MTNIPTAYVMSEYARAKKGHGTGGAGMRCGVAGFVWFGQIGEGSRGDSGSGSGGAEVTAVKATAAKATAAVVAAMKEVAEPTAAMTTAVEMSAAVATAETVWVALRRCTFYANCVHARKIASWATAAPVEAAAAAVHRRTRKRMVGCLA